MKIKSFIIILVSALFVNTGCSDYLDINDDPNKPTTAELSKVLTGAEYDIAMSFASGNYIGSSLPSYVFHLTSPARLTTLVLQPLPHLLGILGFKVIHMD